MTTSPSTPLSDPVHRMCVYGQVGIAADSNGDLVAADYRDGTGTQFASWAEAMHGRRLASFSAGAGSWRHLLLSQLGNVVSSGDQVVLRSELMHLAAVCVRWAEAIDRRTWADRDQAALAEFAAAENAGGAR